jgi:hypothetical protein
MSWGFRQARKITGGAADVVSSAAKGIQKATGAAFDVIADTAKKVGKTVEQIAKDPKMLAAIAISVAYPGAGAALGKALGLGSTTGAIIGNTLINTALNGGDLKKGLQSAVGNYAGVVVGGMASEIVKGGTAGSFLQSHAGLVDKAVNNAVSAAIKGKDPTTAIAGTLMNAAVAESTSTIPGFANLPAAARTAISGSITQALQGKDLDVKSIFADAATSALVGYGLSKIEGYDALDDKYKKLAATTLAASLKGKSLTENVINWALDEANKSLQQTIRDDKEAKAKEEGYKNYAEKWRAQQNGFTNAKDYYDYLNPKPAPAPEPDYISQPETQDESSEEESSEEESSEQESPTTSDEATEPTQEEQPEQELRDSAVIRNLNPSDEEAPSAPSIEPSTQEPPPAPPPAPDPDEVARSQGWESNEEKTLAQSKSYFDPSVYHADVAAQSAGWEDEPDRLAAEARGIADVESWKIVKQEDLAKSEGWESLDQKETAKDLGLASAEAYKQYVEDESAKALGFENAQDRVDALNAGQSTIEEWSQFKKDEASRALGYDDEADQKKAEDAGFKNADEWNESLNEERIIQFFNDNVNRDPTPEELQQFAKIFEPAKDADEFSDEQVKNLIYGSVDTSSYVYGPDGQRYDDEADAVANGVFDFTDEWEGPVYGSDGNEYESAADAIANGVFDFEGVKPEDFVEDVVEKEKEAVGETVWGGQVITDDGTVYQSVADALADGQFNFQQYTPEETVDTGEEAEEPIVWEEDEEESAPYDGPVWGPDGTEYASAVDAISEGVFDYTETAPKEETPQEPEEPIVWEEDEEAPVIEEPAAEEPEEPIVWEEEGPATEETEQPIVWEEDEEEPLTEEPIVWEEDEEEPAPEEPIVWEEDEEEPAQCPPGFHDNGYGLCVADDDEEPAPEENLPPDEEKPGPTTPINFTPRQTLARTLINKIKQAPQAQATTRPEFESPLAQATPEAQAKKKSFEQLGGTSIYPARFRSVLQDYLEGIEAPSELTDVVDGLSAPLPAESLNQPVTMERYGEPNMATSTYFNYGQQPDLDELVKMQQEQNMQLGEGLSLPYAQGGMVAPLLMAKGGTGHGKNAHGALSIVEHSGKHRIDYRQGDAVTGAGDGQSDDIPAMLADGEFVIPADVVAALGNGSTKAGSDKLYEMMHSIRKHHRAAKPEDLPPPAKKSALAYVKTRK